MQIAKIGVEYMGILISSVRVHGFRGLENIEVPLEKFTILTGMNNTGKTSFLRAMQLALSNRHNTASEDFYIHHNDIFQKIIIDILIVPVNKAGNQINDFPPEWEILFTLDRIRTDGEKSFVPVRTVIQYDPLNSWARSEKSILNSWPDFFENGLFWYEANSGKKNSFSFDEIPLYFMDAQRDIIDDIRQKNSFLGKMISKIDYPPQEIKKLEEQIKGLNERAVSSSKILTTIKESLSELNSAMDSSSNGVEITPFTKNLRDLNKGLSINYYNDKEDSFSMEYHGMGTRSWSSILSLKSFITTFESHLKTKDSVFFPITVIEEPESHLHPNAQKRVYAQIESFPGQKIISTHSPYIAGCAKLSQIRHLYKKDKLMCGTMDTKKLSREDTRKIERMVIKSRGEILFSKVLVLFEGETEEQALPILAEHYFNMSPYAKGIDFIGIGGSGNYGPFLHFAESFKIPWVILSDAEDNTMKNVTKAVEKLTNGFEGNKSNVFFLNTCTNFESYLIESGYTDEILSALTHLHGASYFDEYIRDNNGTKSKKTLKTGKTCPSCGKDIVEPILRSYEGDDGIKDALYDCMTSLKTQFGPVVAEKIVHSDKGLPPKFIELFDRISSILGETKDTKNE